MTHCDGVTKECETGDQLRVDFSTGIFENLTRGTQKTYQPLSREHLGIIAQGGWKPMFAKRIATMRADGRIAAT
jgi:hypothetical protein